MQPSILTAGGRYFDFLNPDPATIAIEDIAHGLAHVCRFGGHVRQYYSVAQHSVIVADCPFVPDSLRFAALMHDAAEAYCGDIPTPLKGLLPDYKVIEERVDDAICERFGIISGCRWQIIKQADLVALATEKRDLMPATGEQWAHIADIVPLDEHIIPLRPAEAAALFMRRFLAYAPPRLRREVQEA